MHIEKLDKFRHQALSLGGVLIGMEICHDDIDRCWLIGKDGEEQDLDGLFSGELFAVYHDISSCILLVVCMVDMKDLGSCRELLKQEKANPLEVVQSLIASKKGDQFLQYLKIVPLEIEIGEPDRSCFGERVNDPDWRRQIMNRIAESSSDLNDWKMVPIPCGFKT